MAYNSIPLIHSMDLWITILVKYSEGIKHTVWKQKKFKIK